MRGALHSRGASRVQECQIDSAAAAAIPALVPSFVVSSQLADHTHDCQPPLALRGGNGRKNSHATGRAKATRSAGPAALALPDTKKGRFFRLSLRLCKSGISHDRRRFGGLATAGNRGDGRRPPQLPAKLCLLTKCVITSGSTLTIDCDYRSAISDSSD